MFPRHPLPSLVFMPNMEAAGIEPAQGSPGTWLLHGTHIYEYWWATFVGGNELDKQATRLYAIGEGRKGPVKLGVSINPDDRLRGLQHANPRKLTLLTHIPSPKGFERTVLAILGAHRIHGEWFRREGDVLAVIRPGDSVTRRHDLALACAVFELLALTALLFLAWCEWRGFQPGMCEAYGACGWRRA